MMMINNRKKFDMYIYYMFGYGYICKNISKFILNMNDSLFTERKQDKMKL